MEFAVLLMWVRDAKFMCKRWNKDWVFMQAGRAEPAESAEWDGSFAGSVFFPSSRAQLEKSKFWKSMCSIYY